MPKRVSLSDQLRKAVLESELSRYEISQRTGIAQSILSRFVHSSAGLSLANVDRICDLLGIDLTNAKRKGK